MKTTFYLFIALIAASICSAQSTPCGLDSLGSGQVGAAVFDTITLGNAPPRCVECIGGAGIGCVSIAIPYDFNGSILLNSPSAGLFSFQLTTWCDYLMFDSCGVFPLGGVAGMSFVVSFAAIGNAQMTICGNMGDTVYIDIKSTPSPQEELIPYLDLSTCSPPTATVEPIKAARQYWEFDGVYWRPVDALKPNGLYKIR